MRRRLIYIFIMTVLFVMAALPALAQTAGDTGTGDAISVTATVLFISGAIQYIVEFVRGKWTSLDGDWVRLASFVLGVGAAWWWNLKVAADYGFAGLPPSLDYIATGLVIAFGAGILGTWKNARRADDPKSSIHLEA